jgi:hypothetical protein
MATTHQRLVALFVAASMAACTTLQPLPENNLSGSSRAQRQAPSLAIGTTVTINSRLEPPFELVVTAVNPEFVDGTQDGKPRKLQLSDIESIEQRRFDILRTALVVFALGVVALGQFAKGVSNLSNP